MSTRSMKKLTPDRMKNIEDANPENKQVQSVETNAYNESAVIAEKKQEEVQDKKLKTLF